MNRKASVAVLPMNAYREQYPPLSWLCQLS